MIVFFAKGCRASKFRCYKKLDIVFHLSNFINSLWRLIVLARSDCFGAIIFMCPDIRRRFN